MDSSVHSKIEQDSGLAVAFTNAARMVAVDRNLDIFIKRFGLPDGVCRSLSDLGYNYGISKERIRQIVREVTLRIFRRGRSVKLDPTDACKLLHDKLRTQINESPIDSLYDYLTGAMSHLTEDIRIRLVIDLLQVFKVDVETIRLERHLKKHIKEQRRLARQTSAREHPIQVMATVEHGIWWPNNPRKVSPERLSTIESSRVVSQNGIGSCGDYLSFKMKRYVHFESNEEAIVFNAFEQSSKVIFYREQPFTIPVSDDTHYTPDVLVGLEDGRVFLMEVKPLSHMFTTENLYEARGLYKYCMEHGFGCAVGGPRAMLKAVVEMDHTINPNFEREIRYALDNHNSLRWTQFSALMKAANASWIDLAHLVLNYDLELSIYPYFHLKAPTS